MRSVYTNIRANLTSFERSILWKGAREWNGLETSLRKIETKNSFKLAQKKWVQETITYIDDGDRTKKMVSSQI